MDARIITLALHAMEGLYTSHFYFAGIADGVSVRQSQIDSWIAGRMRRKAIELKTRALIAHDRVLTGR